MINNSLKSSRICGGFETKLEVVVLSRATVMSGCDQRPLHVMVSEYMLNTRPLDPFDKFYTDRVYEYWTLTPHSYIGA